MPSSTTRLTSLPDRLVGNRANRSGAVLALLICMGIPFELGDSGRPNGNCVGRRLVTTDERLGQRERVGERHAGGVEDESVRDAFVFLEDNVATGGAV